jgi:hypothetical protein
MPELQATLVALGKKWIQNEGESVDKALFRSLGCGPLETIDLCPNENPTYILDLNVPLPQEYANRFDLIYDGGTLEHCFNPAEVLRNTVHMLQVGGRIIHHTPMNNWVDHGFYQISPTLFFDFYSAAGFSDMQLRLHFIKRGYEKQIEHFWPTDSLPYGVGRGVRVLAHFTAVKSRQVEVRSLKTLLQYRYRSLFSGDGFPVSKKISPTVLERIRKSIKKRTIFFRAEVL